METIEAVLSASGTGTLRTQAGSYPVQAGGDVAAVRRLLLQAAEGAVRERGEACRLIIDDMGTRHVFELRPDGTRQPIADDGTGLVLEQPAAVDVRDLLVPETVTTSHWRRENRPAPHPEPADLAPVHPRAIPPVPVVAPVPIPAPVSEVALPAVAPIPLLVSGPVSETHAPAEAAPMIPAEVTDSGSSRPAGNPFVRATAPDRPNEAIEPDSILGDAIEIEGLGAQHLVRDAVPAAPAPERPFLTPESVWLLGASGGVGVTTLATLAGGRVIDGGVHPAYAGAPVYVVAATHAAGLERAAEVIRQRARGEVTVEILGLILVHDRPKLSPASKQLARQIASLYPRTMTVPFMPAWREPGTPKVGNNVRVKLVIDRLTSKKRKKS